VWRILARASNRGAKSALWVRRGLDAKAAWAELTADWTAPLEYEAPVREYLEKLKALGYTQPWADRARADRSRASYSLLQRPAKALTRMREEEYCPAQLLSGDAADSSELHDAALRS
jgi:hypothetical protein